MTMMIAPEIVEGNTLAKVEPAQTPLAEQQQVSLLPVQIMRPLLDEYTERRNCFRLWLLEQLREGVHFGVPPGCEPDSRIDPLQWKAKPSLYKAGADFICDLLQMDPAFTPDMDTWKMLGAKEGSVVVCCKLISRGNSPFFPRPKGEILGEGRGAGMAGVKKRDGNGAIKIAQKSAKIDAVINTLGLSDLFTQDLEDLTPRSPSPVPDPSAPRVATRAERQAQARPTPAANGHANQLNALLNSWKARLAQSDKTLAAFAKWAASVLRTDVDMSKPSAWTQDAIDVCKEAINAR